MYCKNTDSVLSVAEKKTIGKLINRLFDHPPQKSRMRKGLKTNYYQGIMLLTEVSRMALVKGDRSSLIMPVTNMDLEHDNKINYVQYATVLEFDNEPVEIEFNISEETNMTWISV